jgi:Na+-driven multidrug efflux pump
VPLAAWLVSMGWGVEAVWFAITVTTFIKGLALAAMFAGRCRTMHPNSREVPHD